MISYFTFGQSHYHNIRGQVFDKDTVVKVDSNDPRKTMFDTFGPRWAMQYDEPPNMEHFPKGIVPLEDAT